MADTFFKLLKWLITAFLIIGGVNMLMLGSVGKTWAYAIAILCFGIVMWKYAGKKSQMPREIMGVTVAVMSVAGAAAFYVPAIPQIPLTADFFSAWALYTVIIGLPVMIWAYDKFD